MRILKRDGSRNMRYTATELRKAFAEADRKLLKKPVSVADVEATLQPYYDCTGKWKQRPLLDRVILHIGGWKMWLDAEGRNPGE